MSGRWRDIGPGAAGAAIIAAALLTPFLRARRAQWGLRPQEAGRRFPGDELVPDPRWSWTHGIAVEAPADAVWPWIAQIGADRAGFYSYQGLENLIGCRIRNAATIHPEWTAHEGDELRLHPQAPPLRIVSVSPGRSLVAYMPPVPTLGTAASAGRWMTASWLFLVEPLGPGRCRVISRYRCATSGDLASRVQFGPALVEPIGFAMDRRMLIGIKQRAEQSARVSPGQLA